ncbi:MAG: hypothetical protein AMK73_01015 [Planctomycetes bacterium SM23_32]|nr:MAG: hypothetical protein AMK73_01015 [Planctomycetes bacterium SM23_32]
MRVLLMYVCLALAAAASGAAAQQEEPALHVKVWLDGAANLVIHAQEMHWLHKRGPRPGEGGPQEGAPSRLITVNGEEWRLVWDGARSDCFALPRAFPVGPKGLCVAVEAKRARCDLKVINTREMAVVCLDDVIAPGGDWYEFCIRPADVNAESGQAGEPGPMAASAGVRRLAQREAARMAQELCWWEYGEFMAAQQAMLTDPNRRRLGGLHWEKQRLDKDYGRLSQEQRRRWDQASTSPGFGLPGPWGPNIRYDTARDARVFNENQQRLREMGRQTSQLQVVLGTTEQMNQRYELALTNYRRAFAEAYAEVYPDCLRWAQEAVEQAKQQAEQRKLALLTAAAVPGRYVWTEAGQEVGTLLLTTARSATLKGGGPSRRESGRSAKTD